ncbi:MULTISPECIES: LuxR C-terminal-related transcriptional regulator [Cysteiniphilum]|uniref:LuxR C-terminal-related transcriptional regulator n=1 Tax=Cysteiniphilum TaxID=2056696 RepID=UPI001782686F|nr:MULTISPECIES: LuxR C-terminal-related transcriptional regulator [Cysteiniphilum]
MMTDIEEQQECNTLILNNDIIKLIINTKEYAKLRGVSIANTEPIKRIINMTAPELNVRNYTFLRVWPDFSIFMLSSDLRLIRSYVLKKLWKEDKVYSINSVEPIYNRLESFCQESKAAYERIIHREHGFLPIVIEYDLGVCKDCHCFLLGVNDGRYRYQELFNQLFDTVLYFYRQFREGDFKHQRVHYFTTEKMSKEHRYYDLSSTFSPYDELKEEYYLTNKNVDYIKLIALGMSASQIANTLNRSLRTVEKSVDAIRHKFRFDNRQQLDVFLQMFYKSKVKEHIRTKEMY